MLTPLRHLGDLLDRIDLGGWFMMFGGFAIIAVTVLVPAWRDVSELHRQRELIAREVELLQMQQNNYVELTKAINQNDPLLLQRLAWDQLRQQPIGGQLLSHNASAIGPNQSLPTVDQWVQASLPPLAMKLSEPDRLIAVKSKLMKLITGSSRPWVLAFGGWLILMGVLLNPGPDDGADEDGDMDVDADHADANTDHFDMADADAMAKLDASLNAY